MSGQDDAWGWLEVVPSGTSEKGDRLHLEEGNSPSSVAETSRCSPITIMNNQNENNAPDGAHRRDYFQTSGKPMPSISALSLFSSKRSGAMIRPTFLKTATSTTTATTTTRTAETKVDITNFRELPSFESFTKVSWAMVVLQVTAAIGGAVLSYYQNDGTIGGIMSGIVGLWFVQMSWVMCLPSKTSSTPYYVGLLLLPLTKSVGFLLVDDPDGNFCDWREFLRRMAILTLMWAVPMYLAGRNTAEVARCIHGDVSRYDPDGKREEGNLFAVRRHNGEEIDEEGVEIRQRAMACTVKYLFIFPMVVYITFNAIGAIVEASGYAEYATATGDSFEVQTGKQFYMDYMRLAYSSIFQGLVAVFTLITISGFGCSAMDLGEIMRFRLHPLEWLVLGAYILFFVAGVFFGSALFNPTNTVQDKLAYWGIFVLPCFLMLCLWQLTAGVLANKDSLRNQRLEADDNDGDADNLLGGRDSLFGVPGFGFGGEVRRNQSCSSISTRHSLGSREPAGQQRRRNSVTFGDHTQSLLLGSIRSRDDGDDGDIGNKRVTFHDHTQGHRLDTIESLDEEDGEEISDMKKKLIAEKAVSVEDDEFLENGDVS